MCWSSDRGSEGVFIYKCVYMCVYVYSEWTEKEVEFALFETVTDIQT